MKEKLRTLLIALFAVGSLYCSIASADMASDMQMGESMACGNPVTSKSCVMGYWDSVGFYYYILMAGIENWRSQPGYAEWCDSNPSSCYEESLEYALYESAMYYCFAKMAYWDAQQGLGP